MGHYINPPQDKQFWLEANGAVWHPKGIHDPEMFHYYLNRGQAVVCLVQNDGFTAGAICTSPDEISRFQMTADDTRSRQWWAVPLEALYSINPEVRAYFDPEAKDASQELQDNAAKFSLLCQQFEKDIAALGTLGWTFIAAIQENEHCSVVAHRHGQRPEDVVHAIAFASLEMADQIDEIMRAGVDIKSLIFDMHSKRAEERISKIIEKAVQG
ncbi:MAG: hypothetical protein B7Z37_02915 [Verrucomicrobia bacterium 12-59-8]|nr:MAG: hypothetical protein B7Z37_02915 [Verrucomicrobia bacterium 12-59-8]